MRRILLALAAFAVVSSAVPAHAQICTPFTDVLASSSFCTNIQWLFNRGITLGCTPTAYCPTQFVRRDQMATFLNRLGNIVYEQGGSAFGATGVLGTLDNQALDIRVNNARAMRYEPNAISPNVIGGSPANSVTAGVRGATIGGGGVAAGDTDPDFVSEAPNAVTDAYGTVAGGYGNRAGDGAGTLTNRPFATVGGGEGNTASGRASTVAGGNNNTASGPASTVAGGSNNIATGSRSFAAGQSAQALHDGCFVWGDDSTPNEVRCDASDSFVARSRGGVYFYSAGTTQATYTGVELPSGATAWVVSSDRRLKENLHTVDTGEVLDKLLALPISTWNLKSQDSSIRHMGAMAQDFRAAFGLGETELGISTLDADGVALAAIQGLNAKLEARNAALEREIADLRSTLEQLLAQVRSRRRGS